MPKRHRLAALVAASLALGSVGLTAAVAGAAVRGDLAVSAA